MKVNDRVKLSEEVMEHFCDRRSRVDWRKRRATVLVTPRPTNTKTVQIVWDGTGSPQSFHRDFLEIVNEPEQ